MKTIVNDVNNEIVIKNSRFIALLFKIDSSNIEDKMNYVKSIYTKATHYCYAYIYKDIKRFSDDGEPGGCAGAPILNVLEKEELTNVLCVVVRYFGGIKLGAGGLVRSYTKAVCEVLKVSSYVNLEKGYKVEIEFSYNLEKQINYLLKGATIIKKDFGEKIVYTALVSLENINKLYGYDYKILDEVFIKKN